MSSAVASSLSSALAKLSESFDQAAEAGLLAVLESVRACRPGLAGIVFIQCGDEEFLSSDYAACAAKLDELIRCYAQRTGPDIATSLIAYEGRWASHTLGRQQAVFLECETRWMPAAIKMRVDLRQDKSGVWHLADYTLPYSAWSTEGPVDLYQDGVDSAKLARERAEVRRQIEEVDAESKKYRRVSNTETDHPVFGRWHLKIQRLGEDVRSLERQIEFVKGQIRRGEEPSAYDYLFPKDGKRPELDPEPEPEEALAAEKRRLRELAGDTIHHCWSALWQPGGLSTRINAMAAVHEALLAHQPILDRIDSATRSKELAVLDMKLKARQSAPSGARSWSMRKDLEQDQATLKYIRWQLDYSKAFVAKVAAEPLDNEEYVAGKVAVLEERIAAMETKKTETKRRLLELERTGRIDPPTG